MPYPKSDMVLYAPAPSHYRPDIFMDMFTSDASSLTKLSHLPDTSSGRLTADALAPVERGPHPARYDDKGACHAKAQAEETAIEGDGEEEGEKTPTRDGARTPTQKNTQTPTRKGTVAADVGRIEALLHGADLDHPLPILPPSDQRAVLDAASALVGSFHDSDQLSSMSKEEERLLARFREQDKKEIEALRKKTEAAMHWREDFNLRMAKVLEPIPRMPTKKNTLEADVPRIEGLLGDVADYLLPILPPSDHHAVLDAAPATPRSTRDSDIGPSHWKEELKRAFAGLERAKKEADEAEREAEEMEERARKTEEAYLQWREDYELEQAIKLSLMDVSGQEQKAHNNADADMDEGTQKMLREAGGETQKTEVEDEVKGMGVELSDKEEENKDKKQETSSLVTSAALDPRLDPTSELWDKDVWFAEQRKARETFGETKLPAADSLVGVKEFRVPSPLSLHANEDKDSDAILKSLNEALARSNKILESSRAVFSGGNLPLTLGVTPSPHDVKANLDAEAKERDRREKRERKRLSKEVSKFLREVGFDSIRRQREKENKRVWKRFEKARSIVDSLPSMHIQLGDEVSQMLCDCYLRATSDIETDAPKKAIERLNDEDDMPPAEARGVYVDLVETELRQLKEDTRVPRWLIELEVAGAF